MARLTEGLRNKVRSLIKHDTGLDQIAVDDLATSNKLQAWEAVEIPERLRFSSRLAIKLVLLFILIIAFVPWTRTITVTGQVSAYTPFKRPQDIEAQIHDPSMASLLGAGQVADCSRSEWSSFPGQRHQDTARCVVPNFLMS